MNDFLEVHSMKGKKPCTWNYFLTLNTELYTSIMVSCRVKSRSLSPARLWSQCPSPVLRVETHVEFGEGCIKLQLLMED